MDDITATGRDKTDEEEELVVEHEKDEEDEEDPQDMESRPMSQAQLQDAFKQDERAGYGENLLTLIYITVFLISCKFTRPYNVLRRKRSINT